MALEAPRERGWRTWVRTSLAAGRVPGRSYFLFAWLVVPLYVISLWRVHQHHREALWCGILLLAILRFVLRGKIQSRQEGWSSRWAGWAALCVAACLRLSPRFRDSLYIGVVPLLIVTGMYLIRASRSSNTRRLAASLLLTGALICAWEPFWSLVIDRAGPSLARWTAASSQYCLYALGGTTARDSLVLSFGTGVVTVEPRCTGLPFFTSMLRLVLLYAIWHGSRIRYGIVASVLVIVGFSTGVIRVAVLATLVQDQSRFHFWHQGNGSYAFTLPAMVIALLCLRTFGAVRTPSPSE